MVEYSERLAWAMKQRGVSVRDLADKLDVSYQAAKKVLDGKSAAFSAPNNARAAKLLGVDSDWLALGEGVAGNAPLKVVAGGWPFETIQVDRFEALPERWKGIAEGRVRDVVEEWEAQNKSKGSA